MNIIFIVAVALLIVVFLFFSYPKMLLLSKRIIYSRYDYRYMKTYKRFFNKSPHGHCIRDEFVYHVLPFIKPVRKAAIYTTGHDISFTRIPFYQTYRQVRKSKGKPICFNAEKVNGHHVKIMGYKDYIYKSGTRVFYYFIDNVFFMGEYVFKDFEKKGLKELLEALSEKYNDGQEITDGEDFYIQRSERQMIYCVNTGFSVILSYIDISDESIYSKVKLICENLKKIGDRISKKDKKDLYKKI